MATSPRFGFQVEQLTGSNADLPRVQGDLIARLELLGAQYDQGPFAERPAATTALRGRIYAATDRGVGYVCTGSAWLLIAGDVPEVETLPSAAGSWPGMEVDWVVDATNNVVWRMRRRGSAWEPRGAGVPLGIDVGASVVVANNGQARNLHWTVMPATGLWLVNADVLVDNPARVEVEGRAERFSTSTIWAFLGAGSSRRVHLESTFRLSASTGEQVSIAVQNNSSSGGSATVIRTAVRIKPIRIPVA